MKGAAVVAVMLSAAVAMGAQDAPKKKPAGPRVKVELKNAQGESAGTVMLVQVKKGVRMRVKLENLPIGQHAIHIHEVGKCDAPDFKTAGGHYNPDGKHHGFQKPEGHHAGDTPESIQVEENHIGEKTMLLEGVTLDQFANRAVVVHEKADDQKSDPAGAAGNRVACGVIPAAPAAAAQ